MTEVTDPADPRLGRGPDSSPVPQNEAYLVLSKEEREKGFVRPVRRTYVHVGPETHELPYPQLKSLASYGFSGCGAATKMSQGIAETYARDPKFYGSTYCVGCSMHLPVQEFMWEGTDSNDRVGN